MTTHGDYNTGISVGGHTGIAGDTYINVGSVSTDGYESDGIKVGGHGSITIDAGLVDTVGGSLSDAIHAYSDLGGTVSVDTNAVTTFGYGERASMLRATAMMSRSASDPRSPGDNPDGVFAYSFDGTTTVNASYVRTYGNHSAGVYAYGFLGATVNSNNAVITSGAYSTGINAISNYGAATVTENYVHTSGDNSLGVDVYGYTAQR